MTLAEFTTIAKLLKSVYTDDKFLPDEYSVRVWAKGFEQYDKDLVAVAVQRYIYSPEGRFIPKPADIISMIIRNNDNDLDSESWTKGWGIVMTAISNYGFYDQINALKFIKEQDEITYETVKRIGFGDLCRSENIMSDRAFFRDAYKQIADRRKEIAMLPEGLRNRIKAIGKERVLEIE